MGLIRPIISLHSISMPKGLYFTAVSFLPFLFLLLLFYVGVCDCKRDCRRRIWRLLRWRSRPSVKWWSTSANRSWISASASWSRSRRSRSRACSRSWTRYTTTSGCVSSCRTWQSVLRCLLWVDSVRRSGTSRTRPPVRASPTTSPSSTVSGSLSEPSCSRDPSSRLGNAFAICSFYFCRRRF